MIKPAAARLLPKHTYRNTYSEPLYRPSTGMQRYITTSWRQTNVNLNTRIYFQNEINFVAANGLEQQQQQELRETGPLSARKTMKERVCNPAEGIRQADEGGLFEGWTLQGVIAVTRHGDRGPIVHVRNVQDLDCGLAKTEGRYNFRQTL